MKWVCKVCGYVYEGDEPPAECPVCKAPASQFEKVEGEMKLAAEHIYGIYDKTVKDNPDVSDEDKAYILEQLKSNFTGECSELVCTSACLVLLIVRAILRSVCTGRRLLSKRLSTLLSSPSCSVRSLSPT